MASSSTFRTHSHTHSLAITTPHPKAYYYVARSTCVCARQHGDAAANAVHILHCCSRTHSYAHTHTRTHTHTYVLIHAHSLKCKPRSPASNHPGGARASCGPSLTCCRCGHNEQDWCLTGEAVECVCVCVLVCYCVCVRMSDIHLSFFFTFQTFAATWCRRWSAFRACRSALRS